MLDAARLEFFGLTRKRIALYLGLVFGAAFFDSFGMAMFLPVLEYIEKGQDMAMLAGSSRMWSYLADFFGMLGVTPSFVGLLALVFTLILVRAVAGYARTCYSVWLTQHIQHRSRTGLYAALARAGYWLHDTSSSGRIVNLATNESIRAGGYFGALLTLIVQGIMILGLLTVLLWLSPAMTLAATLVLGLGGAVVQYFIRSARAMGRDITKANTAFTFMLVERLNGMRLIKLSASEEREIAKVHEASVDVRQKMSWVQQVNARVDLLLEPLVGLLGLVILYVSSTVFGMSLSEVGLFMLLLLRMLPLAKEFLRSRQSLLVQAASVDAVMDGVAAARAQAEAPSLQGLPFAGVQREIRLESLCFAYPGKDRPALDGVSLVFPASKTSALVGPSGAGKSTLVDILPRLRREDAGRITVDGASIDDFDLGSLRRGIGFVSQDVFILNDTVRNNLVFCRAEATDAQIRRALERARAWDFVQSLPQGLDTVLGERGIMLSGGQRQRLSLARALVQDAPLLILDEPTSALDSEVEQDIQAALADIRAEARTTVIIIAHRLSTIRDADRIIVLADGRVAEQGAHSDLVLSEEWYSRVSGMQGRA